MSLRCFFGVINTLFMPFVGTASVVSGANVSSGDVSGSSVSSVEVSPTDIGRSVLAFLDSIHFSKRAVIFGSFFLFIILLVIFELLRSKYVLNITRQTVVLKKLPKGFDGTKLVVLSDLHQMRFGDNNEELAKRIKREEPDYILFAGDMGDCNKFDVDAFYDLLEAVGTDIPFIMSPGNEDLKLGSGRVHRNFIKEVERSGAVMLNNACAEMTFEDEKIYIYGFSQPLEPKKDIPVKLWENARIAENDVLALLGKCPTDAPVILLAHDPRPFPIFRKWGASLVVSGHVQGGIIRLPFLGGLLGPSGELRPRYSGGLYESNGSQLFVTRGLGSSGKIRRFFNSPEIAVLTLVSRVPAKAAKNNNQGFDSVFKNSFGDIKGQFAAIRDYAKSETRSIRDLLDERLTQLRDFFDLLLGKKRSRFAIEADEKKKRNTYIAPNKRKKSGSSHAAPRNTGYGKRPANGSSSAQRRSSGRGTSGTGKKPTGSNNKNRK